MSEYKLSVEQEIERISKLYEGSDEYDIRAHLTWIELSLGRYRNAADSMKLMVEQQASIIKDLGIK